MPLTPEEQRERDRILEEAGLDRAMETLAGRGQSAERGERTAVASADPDGGIYRGEDPRTPFRDMPGARPTGSGAQRGVALPAVPAARPPGELRMPDDADERAPRRGSRRRGEWDAAFERDSMQVDAPEAPGAARDAIEPVTIGRDPGMAAMDESELLALAGEEEPAAPPPEADPIEARALSPVTSPRDRAGALGSPTSPARAAPSRVDAPGKTTGILDDIDKAPDVDPRQQMEAELGAARTRDDVRQVTGRIANALRVLGGGQAVRRQPEAPQVQARQQATMRQTLGDKRAERQQAAQAEQQAASRAMQEQALTARTERDTAQADLARRTADRQDRLADATVATAGERVAGMQQTREQRGERSDPASDVSGRRREEMSAILSAFASRSERNQSAVAPIMEAIEGMSADDVDRLERSGPAWLRDLLHRRGGSGGGAGGGRAAQEAERADVLAQAMVAAGTAPSIEVARAMVGESARTAVSGLQTATTDEARSRIPGYTQDASVRRIGPQERAQAMAVHVADQEFSALLGDLENELAQLTPAERARGVYGLGSERYHTIERALGVVRTQLRQIENAGNSIASQERIEHEIPGLTHGTTVDSILANLRAARRVKHRYVEAVLGAYGYRPDGSGGAGHGGGARASAPVPAASGERIEMVLPDGRRVRAPESQVEALIERGARMVE